MDRNPIKIISGSKRYFLLLSQIHLILEDPHILRMIYVYFLDLGNLKTTNQIRSH